MNIEVASTSALSPRGINDCIPQILKLSEQRSTKASLGRSALHVDESMVLGGWPSDSRDGRTSRLTAAVLGSGLPVDISSRPSTCLFSVLQSLTSPLMLSSHILGCDGPALGPGYCGSCRSTRPVWWQPRLEVAATLQAWSATGPY